MPPVTNHIVLDEMRPHFVARKPRAVGSGFVDPEAGSINRRQSEKYLIEKNYGKLDVKAIIDIMSSHYDIPRQYLRRYGLPAWRVQGADERDESLDRREARGTNGVDRAGKPLRQPIHEDHTRKPGGRRARR